jgi:hypothetical protein
MALSDVFTELMSEYSEGKRQGVDHEHEEHMQVDEFYRQAGVKKMEEAVSFWTHYLVNLNEIDRDTKNGSLAKKILKNKELILVYGSARTIHDFAAYQQYNYRSNIAEGENSADPFIVMIYYAQLIVDLKFDFTGIRTNPIDLLRVQITDIENTDKKEAIVSAYRNVMDQLGVPKKERVNQKRR